MKELFDCFILPLFYEKVMKINANFLFFLKDWDFMTLGTKIGGFK